MLLFKCNCGCHFTLKDENLLSKSIGCSNCGSKIAFSIEEELSSYKDVLSKAGMEMFTIPDGAKIKFSFVI